LVGQLSLGCNGDLRSAVNDLQAGFAGERERKHNVFRVVGKIFKTENYKEALQAADDSEVDFDLLWRWVEENIPAEYEKPQEVAAGFESLARADVFRARILKRQAWRLFKYVRALGIGGVAMAKQKRYSKFSRYAFPSIMKKYSAARQARAALKGAARKAAARIHCGQQAAKEALTIIGGLEGAAEYFGLSEEEAALFASAGKLAGKKAKNEKKQGKRKKRGEEG
jgi:replication factor C large subunit